MKETEMKRVPKLRFPEFTDDWEQRKLGEVIESYSGGTPSVGVKEYYGGQIPFIRSAEINSEITELFLTEEGLKNSSARLVDVGDILYALYGATSGEVGRARLKGAINQAILAIKPHADYDSEYLAQWLRKSKHSIIETYLQGGQGNLSGAIVKELSVDFPSLKEQTHIGAFLQQLDHLINLHQRKLEKLERLKKGVMQKLFSQEVRFKVDDGSEFPDWEEKKLGDDVQFINGRAYKQDELLNSGKYLVLRVGNLFTNDSYYYSDLELDNDKYIENGDLIYAWSATFGPRIYYGEKCIYHYHIWKLKFDENIISKIFLNYYLLYDVEKIKSQRTGGTMVHITKNAMEHRELQFPCLAEQQKIADCLSSLDDVIEKQKVTLVAWEELKKGLLQQMFV